MGTAYEEEKGYQAALEYIARGAKMLFIGGSWVPAISGRTFQTINPSTEEVLAEVAEAAEADVDLGVASARRAFEDPSWANISPHQRGAYLHRLAQLIRKHGEELIYLDSLDFGVPVSRFIPFIELSAQLLEYYAGWPTKLQGKTAGGDGSMFNYTLREPLGVCGIIIPWNSPIWSAVYKIGPALAAGNTVVIKPSELTPLSILRFGELMIEAGLPAGVVNILPGYGEKAGAALARHAGVDKISFTGSTSVGKLISKTAADSLKKVSLELGGKGPVIIFEDADIEKAVQHAVLGFTLNSGQNCVAGTRVFLHESIYDAASSRIVEIANQIKIGDGLEPESEMGPLVSEEQLEKVVSYFELAKAEGATLAAGGSRVGTKGYFVRPTVYTHVDNQSRLAQEEIFGPVVVLIPFKDEHEAIMLANQTVYGLAASVWTNDLSKAHRTAKNIQSGIVWINTIFELDPILPYGGYKQSGSGKDMGEESVLEYTQLKTVLIRL